MLAWQALDDPQLAPRDRDAACQIYATSLARLLVTAREQRRFVPGQGVLVRVAGHEQLIPLRMHGFVWQQSDVQDIYVVGKYRAAGISRTYQCDGWGVPIVAQHWQAVCPRPENSFLPPGGMFAATALLVPCDAAGGAVLELYDPLRLAHLHPPVAPLTSDISAPFAAREVSAPQLANGWIPFVESNRPIREGLFMVEPYQPGKIPVVMVHGLISSPMSWIDLANDLRATPGFSDRFQLWGFRYATGRPFLASAAHLRRDLYRAVATVDPHGEDPALQNIVLVGHSMGGLVSELQAVSSGDALWQSIANRPLEAIATDERTRAELRELFFFDPQPNVSRVILVATPHQGSNWAQRPVGMLASSLVRPDSSQSARHEQLRLANPGVFAPDIERRVPTSIDMLNPDSRVLQAISCLRPSPCVSFHTIFGYGRYTLGQGEGDGVVSVESAQFPASQSRLGVRASHTSIHRKLETAGEVLRILDEHVSGCADPVPPEMAHCPTGASGWRPVAR